MIPSVRLGLATAFRAALCALPLLGAPSLTGTPGAARAQDVKAAAQDVTLLDVVLRFGGTTVTVPLLQVAGTRLSQDEVRALLSTEGAEPWASRLARLDAASLTAPMLRVESRGDAASQTTIYRDVAATDVRAGRIAELTAAGAALAVEPDPKADHGKGTGSYGRTRAEAVDLALLARLYGEAGDGKGALQPLYAAFSVDDVAFADDATTLALARLSGRDFAARPIPATWSGVVAALAALDPADTDGAARARAAGTLADVAEAFSVGALEMTGLSVRESKGHAGTFEIGRIAYAGAAPAGLTLGDVAFTSPDARVRLASLTLSGFSLEPTIAGLRRAATEGADAPLRRLMPVIGNWALADLAFEGASAAGAPADPLAKPPATPPTTSPATPAPGAAAPVRFGLRSLAMSVGPPRDGVPTAGRVSVTGLTMPADAAADVPGLSALAAYGYRDLDLDLVADTAWDEARRELALREVSVSGKEMGRLRLNATLGGIGPELLDPDTAVSSFAALSATAKAVDLTVENGGLFERFIAAQAKNLSLKPDELRKEYVTACVIGVPVILGNSAPAKSLGAALGKFVSKPGRLTVSARAKSSAGLGVVDVSTAPTPAVVLDKLDLTAKAE